MYGVKDLFVMNDNIFVSYTNRKNKEECFNTAILKAKILSTKTPKDAFEAFRIASVEKIPEVLKIEVAKNTIEVK